MAKTEFTRESNHILIEEINKSKKLQSYCVNEQTDCRLVIITVSVIQLIVSTLLYHQVTHTTDFQFLGALVIFFGYHITIGLVADIYTLVAVKGLKKSSKLNLSLVMLMISVFICKISLILNLLQL